VPGSIGPGAAASWPTSKIDVEPAVEAGPAAAGAEPGWSSKAPGVSQPVRGSSSPASGPGALASSPAVRSAGAGSAVRTPGHSPAAPRTPVGCSPDRAAACGGQRRGRAGQARTLRPPAPAAAPPAGALRSGRVVCAGQPVRSAWASGHDVPTGAAAPATAEPADSAPGAADTRDRGMVPHGHCGSGPTGQQPAGIQTAAAPASPASAMGERLRWRRATTLLAGVCAVRAGVGSSRIAAADQATGPPRVVRRMP